MAYTVLSIDELNKFVKTLVPASGDTSIDGVKTFTASPIAPTPTAGDNSTKIATTEYVKTEIPKALNASGDAPIYACRAWVNFNGTGTVAIRGSGNVSSITDNGTGLYSVNFITAMQDSNYAVNVSGVETSGNTSVGAFNNFYSGQAINTVTARIGTEDSNDSLRDMAIVSVIIFR